MGFLSRLQAKYDEAVAMAFKRKLALEKLRYYQITIAKHLFLITHYKDSDAMSHWLGELRGWNGDLRIHNRGKKGAKNYTRSLLWQILWEEPLGGPDEQEEIAAQVARKEKLPVVRPNSEELKKTVSKFIDAVLDPSKTQDFTP